MGRRSSPRWWCAAVFLVGNFLADDLNGADPSSATDTSVVATNAGSYKPFLDTSSLIDEAMDGVEMTLKGCRHPKRGGHGLRYGREGTPEMDRRHCPAG